MGTGDWGLGTGDWGLGTGDWGLGSGDWGTCTEQSRILSEVEVWGIVIDYSPRPRVPASPRPRVSLIPLIPYATRLIKVKPSRMGSKTCSTRGSATTTWLK